jgi:hypothetical protein
MLAGSAATAAFSSSARSACGTGGVENFRFFPAESLH